MDELTHYIVNYYPRLMTEDEKKAQKTIIGDKKMQTTDSPKLQEFHRKFWVSDESGVRDLLRGGEEEFLISVRDRILREHADQVFLNYCPKCGSLAKTPRAKQCPKCFFSWHEEEEN